MKKDIFPSKKKHHFSSAFLSRLSHLKDQFVVPPPQSVDVPDMPLRRPRRPRGPGLRGRGLKEAETESRQGRSTGGKPVNQ